MLRFTVCKLINTKIPNKLWDVLLRVSFGKVRVSRRLSGRSDSSQSPTYIPAYSCPYLSLTHSGLLLNFSGILFNNTQIVMLNANLKLFFLDLYYFSCLFKFIFVSYFETMISTLFFPANILSASLRMNGRWPVWRTSIVLFSGLLSSLNGWTWFCSRSPLIL